MTPTTPPEPTVLDVMAERLDISRAIAAAGGSTGPMVALINALKLLGIDPAGSVARLREDLEIAQKARLAAGHSWSSENYNEGWQDCINTILGDDQWDVLGAGRAGGAG